MKQLFEAILKGDIEGIDNHINELSDNPEDVNHYFKIDISDKDKPKYVAGQVSQEAATLLKIASFQSFIDTKTSILKVDKVPNCLVLDPYSFAYLYNQNSFQHMLAKHPKYIHHFLGVFKPIVPKKVDDPLQVIAAYPVNTQDIRTGTRGQNYAITDTGQFDMFNEHLKSNLLYYTNYGFSPKSKDNKGSLPILPADQLCKWISFSLSTDKVLRDNIIRCLVEGLLTTLSCTMVNDYLEKLYAANVEVFKIIIPQLIQRLKTKSIDQNSMVLLDINIRKIFSDEGGRYSRWTENPVAQILAANKSLLALWDEFCKYRQESDLTPKTKKVEEKPLDVLLPAFLYECGAIPTPLTQENYAQGLSHRYQCGKVNEDNCVVFSDEDLKKIPANEWEIMKKLYPESEITNLVLSLITPGEDYLENLENIVLNKDCTRLLFTIRDHSQAPIVLKKAITAATSDTASFSIISMRKQNEAISQKPTTSGGAAQLDDTVPPAFSSLFAPAGVPPENLDNVTNVHWLKS